jgi:NAD(P)-dependent dehydrogenase (short-subunit alcohol dehydrogenase family)
MDVNLKSVLLGSRFAIPHMIKAGGGSIINTASMAGFTGDSVRSAYGASKAGVVNLTRYIHSMVKIIFVVMEWHQALF